MSNTIEFGIDLGTTNSCIARWESGSVKVYRNNDQMSVTPSAVQILKSGRTVVGRRAYAALPRDPENVAVEFKRWMGQKDRRRFPAVDREYSAEELSAEVLKALREDVRRQTGTEVETAVITVPAAFGALQCEATARAAQLAGLTEAPLLQEPIAAAIGYGARTTATGQYWLVFDLGGGTLDIAVVSTKAGRMNVLEHQGNNLLGGKDIDRAIVETVLLPAVASSYDLRGTGPESARHIVASRLRLKAEEAKIDLSTMDEVSVLLADVGEDDAGTLIEMDVTLTCAQLELVMAPILEKCCALAVEALSGARIQAADLDRILLVGGPTQSPVLRKMLAERIGARIDFSADPMTVVGQGAAVYASTLERSSRSVAGSSQGTVTLKLAFESVSTALQIPVAGRVGERAPGLEVKLEAKEGGWSSGWLGLKEGLFETTVPLKAADVATFWVYLRDAQGQLIETDYPEFSVRNGLVPSAPPLPHTISVEVVSSDGKPALDAVFSKGTPLPAEKRVKYRATHPLVPGDPSSDIAIKLWEGEFLGDPGANDFVGNVLLSHAATNHRLPAGSEIEVTIQVSVSRLISVRAAVPYLKQVFDDRLYMPQRDEQHYSDLAENVESDIVGYRNRLERLERRIGDAPAAPQRQELAAVRRDLDELEKAGQATDSPASPDDSKRVVEDSRSVRGRLDTLERSSGRKPDSASSFAQAVELANEVISQFGGSLEKQQLQMLRRQLEQAAAKGDDRNVTRLTEEVDGLRFSVLFRQDWFWREILDSFHQPGAKFIDDGAARRLLQEGDDAVRRGEGERLRNVVRELWNLQPRDRVESVQDRAIRAGLKRY
jgi:molecular chaperone DnaK